jgi:hypothetical protein
MSSPIYHARCQDVEHITLNNNLDENLYTPDNFIATTTSQK